MPTYVYYNCDCPSGANPKTVEVNVPIEMRNEVHCGVCGQYLKRKHAFTGSVWSPTRNGGHS